MMNIYPCALSIAGSDSGGGAGIQADLKAFLANQVFGTTAITCLTAQNPEGVISIVETPLENLQNQIQAILDFFPIKAAKTGMLFSEAIITKVASLLGNKNFPLVVDPVMVATSGAILLQANAITSMRNKIFPIADLLTPNADEASLLLDYKVTKENQKDASFELYQLTHVPILLKGGHLQKDGSLVDILYDGKKFYEFESEYISGKNTHGTGCTYSAAITAFLARDFELPLAIQKAKSYLHNSILQSHWIGKTYTLNHTPSY